MVELPDGKMAAVINKFWYVENGDNSVYGNDFEIATLDPGGNLINSVPLNLMDELGDASYGVQKLLVSDSGDIIAFITVYSQGTDANKTYIVKVSPEGVVSDLTEIPINQINSVTVAPDNKVFLIYYDKDWNNYVAEFDIGSLKVGEPLKGLPDYGTDCIGTIEGNDEKLLIGNYESLFEYDIKGQKSEKILGWREADIKEGIVRNIYGRADGSYMLITSDWDSGTTEVVNLTKKKRSEVAEKQEITIYSLYEDYQLSNAVIEFNKTYPDYHVTIKEYHNWEKENADPVDSENTMKNDILAGKTPDLLNLQSISADDYVRQGVLEDITPYIENSSEIKLEDYNEKIVDCYRYGDKIISIPSAFEISSMIVSSKEFGTESGWSVAEVIEYCRKHPEAAFMDYSNRMQILSVLLYNNLDGFINWETGECSFDSDLFKSILEFAASYPEEFDYEAMEDTSIAEKFSKGLIIAMDSYIYNFESVQEYTNYLFKGNGNYIGYPTLDGSPSSLIQPSGALGLCKDSKNKEAAWKFVEFTLKRNSRDDFGFPTSNAALKELENKELEKAGQETDSSVGWGDGEMYTYHYATQEEIDEVYKMLDCAKLNNSLSNPVTRIIEEEIGAYFEGQKSLDDCANIIQSRVSIYVQENK
ncbi:MAG: extracellular solute-binding protein [Lachnospiraceae bacterium]|nr:extracellular solute-binding protein [Lachnospiraceae bacterium]